MYISGTRDGSMPAVVFEAGLGDSSASWRKVADSIAKTTQVVRYDRAGLGCSQANITSRTATEIASELHDALSNAQVAPPYVLVSHSAGAWYVLVFAAEYPAEVKGLVLVDPTPPRFFSEVSSLQNEQERSEFASSMAKYEAAALPGRRAEWENRDKAAAQADKAKLTKQMPLIIITAAALQPGRNPAILKYWRDQHERMARTTNRGRVVVAATGHYVQLEQPQIVIREIRQILETLSGA